MPGCICTCRHGSGFIARLLPGRRARFDFAVRQCAGVIETVGDNEISFILGGGAVRYFSAEQLLERLQMSGEQLNKFEQEGIVKGIVKVGRVFYTSRDVYRLRGRVDQPPDEGSGGQVL